MQLDSIYVYPVKSLGGISLQASEVTGRGLRYDRRWMITDPAGRFMTQREIPAMALLSVELRSGDLSIGHRRKDLPPLLVPAEPEDGRELPVAIWNDTLTALRVSTYADAWLSEALGRACTLVYMPDEARRPVDPRYARQDDLVSFADGYPFLIIGQASLDLLNSKLAEPVPMDRFRPNFVFSGAAAHAEDQFRRFRIGSVAFHGVKPCARCAIPTIDQQTAVAGKEPIRTLADYRSTGNNVLFGMNLLCEGPGAVQVGDRIEAAEN
jgi:hypothetical protein